MFTTLLSNLVGLLLGGVFSICLIICLSRFTQRSHLNEDDMVAVRVRDRKFVKK
ncbi:MAG: hypothetical protein PVI75_07695 [Gammaproteobacteria bacterium]|jgi:hypothetical protein